MLRTTLPTLSPRSGLPTSSRSSFYIDFILNNQFKTPWARLPLNVLGEFIVNPEAKSHPLGSNGAVRTDLGSQNKAYMVDVSIGQQKNKNDIQVGYAWNRIEQDAVLAAFVESDQRTQTNVVAKPNLRSVEGPQQYDRLVHLLVRAYAQHLSAERHQVTWSCTGSGRCKAEPYAIRSDLHVLRSVRPEA